MSVFLDALRKPRLLVCLVLVSIAAGFVLAPVAEATCSYYYEGECWNYYYRALVDCDCDLHGCSIPGPPAYMCFQIDCGKPANFGHYCRIPGWAKVHIDCKPAMHVVNIGDCPCNGTLNCAF
jgi:hypothetical protein